MKPLVSVRRPLRGPFTRWPRTSDAVLALVMLLMALFNLESQDSENAQDLTIRFLSDLPLVAYAVVGVGCAALYWRRRQPLVVLGVTLVATILWVAFEYSEDPLIALLVALYSVGRYATEDRWSYAGLGISLIAIGIIELIDSAPAPDIATTVVVASLPWYVGRRIRIRIEYLTVLRERAAYLEREQTAEAERAVAEERSRIARELHDVVAHRVSLMTVQAGAAKTVAADDPSGAEQAMKAVEEEGREALGELRHLLGVLRPEADVNEVGPMPGVADVPRLVDHLQHAGLEVVLTTSGVPADLPVRVDLSAYRIVQEALTNVLKHAGPDTQTEVRLSGNNQGITIEVLDRGSGDTILPGSGQGIVGMRERAELLGGTLEAGPRPGGGFGVVAHLPVGEGQA